MFFATDSVIGEPQALYREILATVGDFLKSVALQRQTVDTSTA